MTESLRVLLVDDEPETLRLVRKILQSDGHQVVEAVDGQEALDLFHQEHPDLILLDIIIPQIDGIEVLKRIRAEDTVTGIIMVSALTSEKLAVEAMVNGADDYVSKPFPLKEIRVRINQAAAKAKLRRENQRLQQQLAAVEERLQAAPVPTSPAPGALWRDVAVLATDLGGLATTMQALAPTQQATLLNQRITSIITAVRQQGAILHNLGGNLMIAVFANDNFQHSSEAALAAALQARSAETAADPTTGLPADALSFGIHAGSALVAHVGLPPAVAPVAMGETVRLACHLTRLAHPGDILVSHTAYSHLQSRVQATPSVQIEQLAGLDNAPSIYRLTGPLAFQR